MIAPNLMYNEGYDNQVNGLNRGGIARFTKIGANGENMLVLPVIIPAPDSE